MALRFPETPLLAAWAVTLTCFLITMNSVVSGGIAENVGAVVVFLLCLPFMSPSWSCSGLLTIGFIIEGVIIGIQAADLCFDVIVLSGAPLSFGNDGDTIPARKVAWLYYRNVVGAVHVNILVAVCCLLLLFGSLACILRSTPEARRKWAFLVAMMIVGNGGYAFVIVPYYVRIRTEVVYNPAFFDNWAAVPIARLVTMITVVASWPIMSSLMHTHVQETKLLKQS